MTRLALAALLVVAAQDPPPRDPPPLEGLWLGELNVMGQKLRLLLRVKVADGKPSATLDSIDQGARGLAVDEIALEGDTLTFAMKSLGASFRGERVEGREAFQGEWAQGGLKLPVTFERTDQEPELRRPQTPKPPFPYEIEELTVKSGEVTLAGTITRPKGEGPFPAALLITGSGAQDRDESLLGHKPFLVIADRLTRDGFAVLRMDDRGVGGSTGSVTQSTIEDSCADALACVATLRERKDIDPKRIGLIGHSEGGWVAPLAASKSRDVAWIVLLAGPAVSGEAILKEQLRVILKAAGAGEEVITRESGWQATTLELVKTEKDPAELERRLREHVRTIIEESPEEQREALRPRLEGQIDMILTPWFRALVTYDPTESLSKVRCPVLVMTGERDLQVPPAQSHPVFASIFEKSGLRDYAIVKLKGLNHLFQTCRVGHPSEYATIEETFAPAALDVLAAWLRAR